MRYNTWNYRVSFLVLFCLAVLCWSLSGNAYGDMHKRTPAITFQNVSSSLLAADYEPMIRSEAQAKEPLPFTLWSQTDNQRVAGVGTGRTQDLSWIAAKGDTRLLLPVMQTLHEVDVDGCLIDKATAEALFGNNNAVGRTVKMAGKEYTVRGVIDGPGRTMVTQLARESGQVLHNITVSGVDTDTFLLRHGLSAAVTVKSSQYVFLARILHLLPIMTLILVGLLLLQLLRRHWREYQVRRLLVSVGMLGAATAGLLLLATCIPDRLIPSQWSDFGFWEAAGREFVEMAADFLSAAKLRPDWSWLSGIFHSAFGILGAYFVICMYNLFCFYLARQSGVLLQTAEDKVDHLPPYNTTTILSKGETTEITPIDATSFTI